MTLPSDGSPSDPLARDTALTALVVAAGGAVAACVSAAAEATGLSGDRWRALAVLGGASGRAADATGGALGPGLTMGEVAARLGVPAPTATRVVDHLVGDGLAFRRSDEWDRRRVLVHVSHEGHEVLRRGEEALRAVAADPAAGATSILQPAEPAPLP